jgi:alpha-ribazole phosphatase
MPRRSIWLIRHGQTLLNQQRRYQGRHDSPLSPLGLRQAQTLAQRLKRQPFDLVLVAEHQRCIDTAQIIVAQRNLDLQIEAGWNEQDQGQWEGLNYAEMRARYGHQLAQHYANPLHSKIHGGESLAEAQERIKQAWQNLLQSPAQRILIISGAYPIQSIICQHTNTPLHQHWRWRIDLGSLSSFDIYPTATIMRHINEVPRLVQ